MTLAAMAVVTMPRVTGLARDEVENTFTFKAKTATALDLPAIDTALEAFYNTIAGGATKRVSEWINETVSRTASTHIRYYDLTAILAGSGGLGAPIRDTAFTLHAPAFTTALPDETAVCISFHADRTGIVEHGVAGARPRASYRGRVFIGPLVTQANDYTSGISRVDSNLRTDFANAATALVGVLNDAGNCDLAIWSRAHSTQHPVVGGWVDDAVDKQPRRGIDATGRTLWGGTA